MTAQEALACMEEWLVWAEPIRDPATEWTEALAVLRGLVEQQTKAGVGPGIFPRVGQNPTLGGPSPGSLSTEDERAIADLWSLINWAVNQAGGYFNEMTNAAFNAHRHIRQRLSAPVTVTREWVEEWAEYLWPRADADGFKDTVNGVVGKLREIGVIVEEER